MTKDELYMNRCLQLAQNGILGAAPNPMVGAVIVHNDRIIGEGYHIHCGGPHAEVNAFRSVKDESLLPQSTLYVSLEPCAHFGHTPPCARLVVSKQVARVVVGCIDPFAKVQGRGIQMIREAGIPVTVGVLEKECQWLNRRFFTFHTHKRPYILLKWAQTADHIMGLRPKILRTNTPRLNISNPQALRHAHTLRSQYQSILVGYTTALTDNPSLNVRLVDGPNPLRIVIDPQGTLPASLHLFDSTIPTLVAGHKANPSIARRPNVEQLTVAPEVDIYTSLLTELHRRNIQSLMVEGGRATHDAFLQRNLWDEIHAEHSAIPSPHYNPSTSEPVLAPTPNCAPYQTETIGTSIIHHYYRQQKLREH